MDRSGSADATGNGILARGEPHHTAGPHSEQHLAETPHRTAHPQPHSAYATHTQHPHHMGISAHDRAHSPGPQQTHPPASGYANPHPQPHVPGATANHSTRAGTSDLSCPPTTTAGMSQNQAGSSYAPPGKRPRESTSPVQSRAAAVTTATAATTLQPPPPAALRVDRPDTNVTARLLQSPTGGRGTSLDTVEGRSHHGPERPHPGSSSPNSPTANQSPSHDPRRARTDAQALVSHGIVGGTQIANATANAVAAIRAATDGVVRTGGGLVERLSGRSPEASPAAPGMEATASTPEAVALAASGHVPDLVPVVLTWNYGGKKVSVTGAWDGWRDKVPMSKDGAVFILVLYLPCGHKYHYKYLVDENWQCNPSCATETDSEGNTNNTILVQRTEPEFDVADGDDEDVDRVDSVFGPGSLLGAYVGSVDGPPSPPSSYNQSVLKTDETSGHPLPLPDIMVPSREGPEAVSHVLVDHLFVADTAGPLPGESGMSGFGVGGSSSSLRSSCGPSDSIGMFSPSTPPEVHHGAAGYGGPHHGPAHRQPAPLPPPPRPTSTLSPSIRAPPEPSSLPSRTGGSGSGIGSYPHDESSEPFCTPDLSPPPLSIGSNFRYKGKLITATFIVANTSHPSSGPGAQSSRGPGIPHLSI